MAITIVDLNKKFYTYRKDLVVLEKVDAIREAIKNTLKLSESDIPFNDVAANIDYSQLKLLTHFNATQIMNNIESALLKIDYVKSANIKFFYKTPEKNIKISVVLEDLNEGVIFDLDLASS